MSYFEKIGNSISDKGREISQKVKAFSETSSLNNVIKNEQHKIDTNYKMMGKLYFEKFGDCPSEEFSESISAVKASLKKISETQEQITMIRNRNCCQKCGAPFKIDAVFCSKCGARVKEEKAKPEEIKCANCGNKLDEGALFCDNCGAKVGGDIPLPDTSENEKAKQTEAVNISDEKMPEEMPEKETNQCNAAKKCPSCGAEADDEQALFCNDCGSKL